MSRFAILGEDFEEQSGDRVWGAGERSQQQFANSKRELRSQIGSWLYQHVRGDGALRWRRAGQERS